MKNNPLSLRLSVSPSITSLKYICVSLSICLSNPWNIITKKYNSRGKRCSYWWGQTSQIAKNHQHISVSICEPLTWNTRPVLVPSVNPFVGRRLYATGGLVCGTRLILNDFTALSKHLHGASYHIIDYHAMSCYTIPYHSTAQHSISYPISYGIIQYDIFDMIWYHMKPYQYPLPQHTSTWGANASL